jgi:hypothetical protein
MKPFSPQQQHPPANMTKVKAQSVASRSLGANRRCMLLSASGGLPLAAGLSPTRQGVHRRRGPRHNRNNRQNLPHR